MLSSYSTARVYVNRKTRIKPAKNRMQLWIKIKGLLEPAHSCHGLSLYWFLRLAEYRYSWIQFMWTFKTFGINFLLFLDSCVIRKLVHSSWWELKKKRCVGWRWDGRRSLGRQFPFCWCVYVCGAGSSCKPMTIYGTQVNIYIYFYFDWVGKFCSDITPTSSRAKWEYYMKAWNYIKNGCDQERDKGYSITVKIIGKRLRAARVSWKNWINDHWITGSPDQGSPD